MISEEELNAWETEAKKESEDICGGAIIYPNNRILALISEVRRLSFKCKKLHEGVSMIRKATDDLNRDDINRIAREALAVDRPTNDKYDSYVDSDSPPDKI